jgi:hypothetical protein
MQFSVCFFQLSILNWVGREGEQLLTEAKRNELTWYSP